MSTAAAPPRRVAWAERAFRDFDPDRVLYEDDDVIVVDKPAGVPCQATRPGSAEDLPSRLRRFLAARRGVSPSEVYLGTHQRLDRESSGVLVYTVQPSANAALARQFEARAVEKTYVAAAAGAALLPGREIVHSLAPGPDARTRVVADGTPGAKLARTLVLEVSGQRDRSLVRLRIETGRTHQVRVQLAALGCPLAGDGLYGGPPAFRVLLHAERLVFEHPRDRRRIEVRAAAPPELEDWVAHGARSACADARLLRSAIDHACQRRFELGRALLEGSTTTFRLMHEEADAVPGFGVDVYDEWLVARIRGEPSAGEEAALLRGLAALEPRGVYLKRHPKQANALTRGQDDSVAPTRPVLGEAAPETMRVYERGVPFEVRLYDGLRTGLFLDQRDNRRRIQELASDKRVLNLFAYTGSFSVAALAGGAAAVTSVDVSRAALQWAERNVANVGSTSRHRVLVEDAFDALERAEARGDRFDVIVVDPPSYATTKRGRFRVTKDYVSLCRAALRVLSKGGVLFACLNHYGVSQTTLRRFVRTAAEGEGLSLMRLRDTPAQVDFLPHAGAEVPAKSVLAWLSPDAGPRPKHAMGSRTSRRTERRRPAGRSPR